MQQLGLLTVGCGIVDVTTSLSILSLESLPASDRSANLTLL